MQLRDPQARRGAKFITRVIPITLQNALRSVLKRSCFTGKDPTRADVRNLPRPLSWAVMEPTSEPALSNSRAQISVITR